MIYLCISLFILTLILAAYILFLKKTIRTATSQMEEIETHPNANRQIKAASMNHSLEELLNRINRIYQARQEERIAYQRRETQIRREIQNISHDLRTPLTSILGYVDLMEDADTTEVEKEEYLRIIRKRAKVLQGFIEDFYEISRIEGDEYPLLFDSIPVQTMIREAAVAYYNEFEKRNITVSVELDKGQCFIVADKVQFHRILNNLIQNALKYAEHDFMIKQYSRSGKCYIRFMNDKSSMTEEELKNIFDRFYTADRSRNNGSTGLGLTITKLLVEKMKGKIEAKFEGDLFVIELQWRK